MFLGAEEEAAIGWPLPTDEAQRNRIGISAEAIPRHPSELQSALSADTPVAHILFR
jgi:hypothetical protein